jgi:hypothetical protein
MPQDNLLNFRNAIAKAQEECGEAAELYACSKGHPYIIGDCGQPYFRAKCPECNETIGGRFHELVKGNTKLEDWKDQTLYGHCLGPAIDGENVTGERLLSPAATALIRLLLHGSMYLGCLNHSKEINSLIIPSIPDDTTETFLIQHLNKDLKDICNAFGKNEDDVLLLVHLLLNRTANLDEQGEFSDALKSKEERESWELDFANIIITPVFENLDENLRIVKDQILNDKDRFGNNPFLKLLYEPDNIDDEVDLSHIENTRTVWRYRAEISLKGVAQKLQLDKNSQNYSLLKLFLKEDSNLRLLKHLPSIMKLFGSVSQQLARKISRQEAGRITIVSDEFKEMFQLTHIWDKVQEQIEEFKLVWNSVRHQLVNFALPKGKRLTQEQCDPVTDQTTLDMLLPSKRGQGLCPIALVTYLCQIQNKFMEEYSRITNQRFETEVSIQEACLSQMIVYDPQKDLLPLVLANCSYSLKAGQGTSIEYKFASLERQIDERFIRGKPRLNSRKLENLMIFMDDASYVKLFSQLDERIPQEPLPYKYKREIDVEMKGQLTKLQDSLSNLDIALGFLVSVGGDPKREIHKFMLLNLQMKKGLYGEKIQSVNLRNTKSLWLTLNHLLAKLKSTFKQDPFESIDDKYQEELPDELKQSLDKLFQNHSNIDIFLSVLFECIHFQLTVSDDDAEETDNTRVELSTALREYGSELDDIKVDWRLPDEIQVKHCLSTWRHVVNISVKQNRIP